MKLIRGIHNLSQAPHGCVLTIGNFDGVHRGHQALLQRLRAEGRQRGLPVVVMIFEPQPLELFAADKAPARLTRLREKLNYLAESGVDYVLCVRFDRRFAALTAQDFISELLVRQLGVQFLAVGDDFRFGAGRQGDFLLLQKAGVEFGFDVTSTQPSVKAACASAARRYVRRWRTTICPSRRRCWGHPFTISGRVVHGDELGRTIGFPTANLPLRRQVSPGKRGLCGRSDRAWRQTFYGGRQHWYSSNGLRRASAAGSSSPGCCNGPLRSPYRCNTA
ncbi:bifunctional riboflavin kinase/FMN adenylyltransferase [Klebsiella michiganensis]|nr:bifunctional riboflavin kinase/FMN adenylyltransferase [Klebsiella michiganensis]